MGRKRKRADRVVSPIPIARPEEKSESRSSAATIWLAPAVAIVLILTGGVIYGLQTHRWAMSGDVQAAAARLQEIPQSIGDWQGTDSPISDRTLKVAGAVGYVNRVYQNRVDGRRVSVMILCGDHGPISLHPPTVCFVSAGWKLKGIQQTDVESQSEEALGSFQVAQFRRSDTAGPRQLTTFWAWNASGEWECPKRPRFAYAGSPHLYKIYVSCANPASKNSEELNKQQRDSCIEFMRLLLPALKRSGI